MTEQLTADVPYTELRDEIVRQSRAKWEAELAEVQRQAAWDALTKYAASFRYSDHTKAFRDAHYAPTPRSVTLPCGDVVTREDGRFVRKYQNGSGLLASGLWPHLVRVSDTGADFDALKAFVASVEAK